MEDAFAENTAGPVTRPFSLLVEPGRIQAAAERIAAMGLPRVVVKAFTDKETPGRKPRNRRPAEAMAEAA